MRHLVTALILAAGSLLPCLLYGQLQTLKKGDDFPDIAFKNVYNYSKSELRFSELRPKLVILDFWSTSCLSCIRAFPKIEKLQTEYKDQLQVVMVTSESKKKVDSFFALRPQLSLPDVIQIVGDSLLHELFERASISLNVWVDGEGKIAYITELFEFNNDQIKKYLGGDTVTMVPYQGRPSYAKTLFREGVEVKLLWFSYLSKYNHINIGSNFDLNGVNVSECGASVVELYMIAFNERWKKDFHRPNRLVLEMEDSFKYVRPERGDTRVKDWLEMYCYTYQLFLPSSKQDLIYKTMQQDLLRYFDLVPRIEKRTVPAFALVVDSSELIATKGGKSKYTFRKNEKYLPAVGKTRELKNKPFSVFVNSINGIFENNFGLPVIDKSGYSGSVDIVVTGSSVDMINEDLSSASKLREELESYGIKLLPTETEIEILVLRAPDFKGTKK